MHLPPELEHLRTATLASEYHHQRYENARLDYKQAIQDKEIHSLSKIRQIQKEAYGAQEKAQAEMAEMRAKAIQAGHSLAELERLTQRWYGHKPG